MLWLWSHLAHHLLDLSHYQDTVYDECHVHCHCFLRDPMEITFG